MNRKESLLSENTIALVSFILLVLFLSAAPVSAQSPYAYEENPFYVYFESYPSPEPEKTLGIMVIQIDYDDLTFLKSGDKFVARYELSVEILDELADIADQKFWREEIVLDSFDETILSDRGYQKKLEFNLAPGKYSYVVQMSSLESRKVFERTGEKNLDDFWNDFAGVSDVVFTRTTEIDTTFNGYLPSDTFIRAKFEEGFSAQFALFSFDNEPFQFVWRVYNILEDVVALHGDSITLTPGNRIINIDIPFDGRSFFPGKYIIRTTMYHPMGGKKERLKPFNFTWVDRPMDSFNFDEALDQMVYILPKDDISKIEEMSYEDKEKYFMDFWNERDIFADTDKNELLEEYFLRVEVANQEFSVDDKPGWDTDRGMVFCKYGKPDVRESYFTNKADMYNRPPREIWSYLKARKKFIFVDRSREGHFLLVSESTISR